MAPFLSILRWCFLTAGFVVFSLVATGVLVAVWVIYGPVREFAEEAALQEITPKCAPPTGVFPRVLNNASQNSLSISPQSTRNRAAAVHPAADGKSQDLPCGQQV